MERELPEIKIEGTQYQFDIQQMALLEKERPEWRPLLEDMKDAAHITNLYMIEIPNV